MIDFDLAAAHPAYRDVIVETYGAPLPLLARPTFLTLDPKSATTQSAYSATRTISPRVRKPHPRSLNKVYAGARALESGGSARGAARRIGVGESTATAWVGRWRQTGSMGGQIPKAPKGS